MGARGPAPRPTNITRLLGNPGHRVENTGEPMPPKLMPTPPDWLEADALVEWSRVAQDLYDIGVLTKVDRTALAAYCQAYARWVECEKSISLNGITMQGRLGLSPRPEVGMAQKWLGIIKQYCAEFGLTPSARARM